MSLTFEAERRKPSGVRVSGVDLSVGVQALAVFIRLRSHALAPKGFTPTLREIDLPKIHAIRDKLMGV